MASKGPGTGIGIFGSAYRNGYLGNGHASPAPPAFAPGPMMRDLEAKFLTIDDFNAVTQANNAAITTDFQVICTFVDRVKQLEAGLAAEREKSAALEARLEKLEAEHMRFTGLYSRETEYVPGDLVQLAGSMWLATMPSINQVPGQSPAWRLIVKNGGLK